MTARDGDIEVWLKQLAPVIDEHAEWFGGVMLRTFYPETAKKTEQLAAPLSFGEWLRRSLNIEVVDQETLHRISKLHQDLYHKAEEMVTTAERTWQKPPAKMMHEFITFYEEFLSNLRRLEIDLVLEDSGIDSLTGLRSKSVMPNDLKREMERRARRGRPFCVAIARIDYYDEIASGADKDTIHKLLKRSAEIIKQCVRSYDDAYRLPEGEFLLSLKHADRVGGMAAISRMRKITDEEKLMIPAGPRQIKFSMSYIVAEPTPGEDMSDVVSQLQQTLARHKHAPDSAFQHNEVSPLQRYLTQIDDPADRGHQ